MCQSDRDVQLSHSETLCSSPHKQTHNIKHRTPRARIQSDPRSHPTNYARSRNVRLVILLLLLLFFFLFLLRREDDDEPPGGSVQVVALVRGLKPWVLPVRASTAAIHSQTSGISSLTPRSSSPPPSAPPPPSLPAHSPGEMRGRGSPLPRPPTPPETEGQGSAGRLPEECRTVRSLRCGPWARETARPLSRKRCLLSP